MEIFKYKQRMVWIHSANGINNKTENTENSIDTQNIEFLCGFHQIGIQISISTSSFQDDFNYKKSFSGGLEVTLFKSLLYVFFCILYQIIQF